MRAARCLLSGHRHHISQDIDITRPARSGDVQGTPRHHRVVVEGRSQREVARAYGINQSWVSRLVARYRAEGEAAFEPRSRRPKTSPTAIPPATVTLITELRGKLTAAGLDAGPGHHRLAPRPPPRHPRLGGHHQPLPDPARAGHPTAHQAPQGLLPAVPGRAAEPMLAGRLHPLPARRPPRRTRR